MIDAATAQARAQAAGYTLATTGDARYFWVAPCKQKGGRVKHNTPEQAWQECCQTHQLRD